MALLISNMMRDDLLTQHRGVRQGLLVDGNRLRDIRLSAGLTQEQAARHAGYSSRFIRKLERGGRVTLSALKTILGVYEVHLNEGTTLDCETLILENSIDTWESLVGDWFDRVLNGRNLSAIDPLVTHDVRLLLGDSEFCGREAVRLHYASIFSNLDSFHISVDRTFVGEESVSIYWNARLSYRDPRCDDESNQQKNAWSTVCVRGNSLMLFRKAQIAEIEEFCYRPFGIELGLK